MARTTCLRCHHLNGSERAACDSRTMAGTVACVHAGPDKVDQAGRGGSSPMRGWSPRPSVLRCTESVIPAHAGLRGNTGAFRYGRRSKSEPRASSWALPSTPTNRDLPLEVIQRIQPQLEASGLLLKARAGRCGPTRLHSEPQARLSMWAGLGDLLRASGEPSPARPQGASRTRRF